MIRLLNDNDKKIVVGYIERNHIECAFQIGNVEHFGITNRKEYRRCGDYFGYFEENDLKGILPIYNLGSCIPHFETINAADEFAEIIKTRKVDYLLGMRKHVQPIYERIKDFKTILEYSDDSYYINEDPREYNLPDVEISAVSEVKLDDALNFMLEARRVGFGDNPSREDLHKVLSQRAPEEDYVFLLKEGRIAAQACIQTTTSKINQIGGVYTTESERGKGYCKAIVSKLCSIIKKRGKIPTLMVRKNNVPAVRAYVSLGFKYYDDYNIIKLR